VSLNTELLRIIKTAPNTTLAKLSTELHYINYQITEIGKYVKQKDVIEAAKSYSINASSTYEAYQKRIRADFFDNINV